MELPADIKKHKWCVSLLNEPGTKVTEIPTSRELFVSERAAGNDARVSNSMFAKTLYSPDCDAILAQVNFQRPSAESDAIYQKEYCYLIAVGSGLDGLTGRAHGGFNALILDQLTGTISATTGGTFAPATARLEMDYSAPVGTPGVVLCRGWVVERSGRKTWVKGTIEDGQRKVFAKCKALFIDPKTGKL